MRRRAWPIITWLLATTVQTSVWVTSGCRSDEPRTIQNGLTLQQVQSADPTAELERALAQRDYRFVGVWGYALEVPGAEDVHQPFGVKVIEGTSDVMDELQRVAREYARRYNTLLIEKLKLQGKIPQ